MKILSDNKRTFFVELCAYDSLNHIFTSKVISDAKLIRCKQKKFLQYHETYP